MALPDERQSGAPKIFGTLSIIFSSITLFFSFFSVIMLVVPIVMGKMQERGLTPTKPDDVAIFDFMKSIYLGIGLHGLILTVMSALLLAIGIGQLRYRAWARTFTVYWSIAALAAIVGMIAINMAVIGPAYARLLEMAARGTKGIDSAGQAMGAFFGGAYSIFLVIFYAPYPILMLAFFRRPRVRLAMLK
jgi:hypothetical protein